MRTYRRLSVHLSKRDRKELRQLLRKGIQPVRTVLRALTLLQLDAGQAAGEVASQLQLTSKAVREIGRRYEYRKDSSGRSTTNSGPGRLPCSTPARSSASSRWCAVIRPQAERAGRYG